MKISLLQPVGHTPLPGQDQLGIEARCKCNGLQQDSNFVTDCVVPDPTGDVTVAELRYIGKANVTPERVAHLRQLLSPEDRRRLIEDIRLAPAWMHRHFRVIAQEENVMRNGTPQPSGSTPPDFRSNVDNQ